MSGGSFWKHFVVAVSAGFLWHLISSPQVRRVVADVIDVAAAAASAGIRP